MAELGSEGEMTRNEVAAFLREFADELDGGTFDGHPDQGERRDRQPEGERREEFTDGDSLEPKRVTLIVGGDSATVTVPNTVEFDVEVGSRSAMLRSGVNQAIDFELSWEIENPDEFGEDRLEVE